MPECKEFKPKTILFLIAIIVFSVSGCSNHPPDCPNVSPGELLYPSVSVWGKIGYVWQDDNHILYLGEQGQFYSTSLVGSIDELDYIDSPHNPPYITLVGWSPDGSLLAFEDEEQGVLRIINLKNGQEQEFPITDSEIYHVSWSPSDPNMVVLGEKKGGFWGGQSEFLWDLSTSTEDGIKIGRFSVNPTWSPDGEKIAVIVPYGNRGADDNHLRVLSVNTQELIYAVPEGACQGQYFSWSPDSQQLAFDARLEGGSDIFTAMIDNAENASVNVTNTPMVHEYNPQWSPNGESIVYIGVTEADGFSRDVQQDIYLVEVSTGKITQLTDSDLVEVFPIWSPNGKYIAFMSTDRESWNLEVMNANGEERKVLASWDYEE